MSKFFKTLLISIPVVLSLAIFSCKKDKASPEIVKPIITLRDSLMDGGGVRLFGQIKPNDQITDYGFEYGTDSLMNTYITLSSGKTVTQFFNADILEGLVTGQKYFFRAYEVISGTETHGDIKFFISQGSKPLIITKVTPSPACMLDTVTIHGKYFDVKKTMALFDNTAAKTVSITDSTLVCIIPNLTMLYNHGLTIKDNDNMRYAYQNFNLATPVITSVSSGKATGDTVDIVGNNFDKAINYTTEVDFGITKAQIVSTSKTKIRVIVPLFYYASVPIKVTSQFQTATSPQDFTIAAPIITQVPASASIMSLITITGKNFSPIYYYDYDEVFVNGVKTNLYNGSGANTLIAQVPDIPYPNRTATVSVNVFGQNVNYNGTISITDKWVMMSSTPIHAQYSHAAFVANNQAYCFAAPNGSGPAYAYKFNPADYSWTQGAQLPALNGMSSLVCNGSRVFVYSFNPDGTGSFMEYLPASQQLVNRAPFPGEVRGATTSFYIGNTVFLGFGSNAHGYTDFYAYNTQTDTWKQVTGMSQNDFGGFTTGYFSIGTNGYILYQSYFGSYLWQYNSVTDTWSRKADLQAAEGSSFILNGKAYLCGSGVYYIYDPVADTWTKGTTLGSGYMTKSGFGFTLGSKSYVGNTDNNGQATYLYSANNSDL